MKRKFLRYLYWHLHDWISSVALWLDVHDVCEVCKKESAANVCIGCDRRICFECNSGYYEDETLCMECRKEITPEEEAEDRQLAQELEREP
jgi:hypothetical protein